jgi:hypothetical protein
MTVAKQPYRPTSPDAESGALRAYLIDTGQLTPREDDPYPNLPALSDPTQAHKYPARTQEAAE